MTDKIKALIAQNDLEALYHIAAETDELSMKEQQELFVLIMEHARENLHEKIAANTRLDFDDKSEHFLLRIIYEDTLASYTSGDIHEAREGFALLSEVSNSDIFREAMQKHLMAVHEGVNFEEFVQTWLGIEEPQFFFISSFASQVDEHYQASLENVRALTENYAKLFK